MASGMGSFVFRWYVSNLPSTSSGRDALNRNHTADQVYVTGTFDDWAKSIKLDKQGEGFAKRVELPLGQKIAYKFVVDGNWTTDPTAPQEDDGASNVNNVLTPDQITKPENSPHEPQSAMMSGVSAESTTAKLAGEVPKEASREKGNVDPAASDLPGTFPQTPGNEASDFSVKPIPATSGAGNPINLRPGEPVPDPSTITSNTISSTVKDDPSLPKSDESEKAFGVTPLPATSGFGNPISLEPGQKVPDPSTFTSNTIDTHVTTDKESYEKGSNAPQLPDVVTPQNERDSKGASMFSVPGISSNTIPESSLPMGDTMPLPKDEKDSGPMIQSAGAGTTTAALAGNVPKEPRGIPQIVQESQKEAGQDVEASRNREAVKEKSEVEKELESKVSEAPPTSEGITGQKTGSVEVGAPSHGLPPSVQESIDEINRGSAIAPAVPDIVQESITDSHVSPEAAGDKTMVNEKSAMENELLKKVPAETSAGQPAPIASAALTESAPAPTDTLGAPSSTNPPATSSEPPSTTAAPSAQSKGAKSFPSKSSAPPSAAPTGSDAPVTSAAAPAATPATEKAARKSSDYSREVSPMTKTDQQSKPSITTGLASGSAPQTSEAASSKAAASPTSGTSASTDKKSKRASGFFGKLKAKFSDKDKDKK
ncbi:MAG: hypothetical protein Q9219_005326 [cf. Caloplaca sp. 3 TL-2023]